jgi:hypothetical protein
MSYVVSTWNFGLSTSFNVMCEDGAWRLYNDLRNAGYIVTLPVETDTPVVADKDEHARKEDILSFLYARSH